MVKYGSPTKRSIILEPVTFAIQPIQTNPDLTGGFTIQKLFL